MEFRCSTAEKLVHVPLIPAKAGIQFFLSLALGPRFRGDERDWSIQSRRTVFYRNPSSPLTSATVSPPTRASGRPLSVTATATMISFARGASLIRTSMPSK